LEGVEADAAREDKVALPATWGRTRLVAKTVVAAAELAEIAVVPSVPVLAS